MSNTIPGKMPHVEWIDLNEDGVLVEVAVVKRDTNGNVYFIRLDHLDLIDKQRLAQILSNRNAPMYELWDLMSNITLGNGVNALEFFHQMVRIKTASGKILRPTIGQMGAMQVVHEAAPEVTAQETEAVVEPAPKKTTRAKKS